jgi:hypothetical protein
MTGDIPSDAARPESDRKTTLLIMLRHGMSARILFRSDFLKFVDAAGVRIVAACPAADESYLRDELSPYDVELVNLPEIKKGLVERVWSGVTNTLAWGHPGVTRTVTIKWLDRGVREGDYLSLLAGSLSSVLFLHKSRKFRRFLEWVDSRAFSHPEFGRLIDACKPDAVLTTYSFEPDTALIREARKRNIPALAMVKSWDNLTSKTRISVEPDRLLVWSPYMKREAMQYHFVPEHNIPVVGAPGFDDHFRNKDYGERAQYLAELGADPEAKLILYSPGVSFTISDEENLRLIHEVLTEQDFEFAWHVHIRKLPKVQLDLSAVEAELGMTSEMSGRVVETWADKFDPGREDIDSLGRAVHHADLLVHLGSTIAIDAACHDTPSIGYGLDATKSGVHHTHVARHTFDLVHNRMLGEIGATKIVHTRGELIDAVRTYLSAPETDRSARATLVDRVIWKRDGRSGERLAREVLTAMPITHSHGEEAGSGT